jgi:hypothetical protein
MAKLHFEVGNTKISVHSPDNTPFILFQGFDGDLLLVSYEELCEIKAKIDELWFYGKPPQ